RLVGWRVARLTFLRDRTQRVGARGWRVVLAIDVDHVESETAGQRSLRHANARIARANRRDSRNTVSARTSVQREAPAHSSRGLVASAPHGSMPSAIRSARASRPGACSIPHIFM